MGGHQPDQAKRNAQLHNVEVFYNDVIHPGHATVTPAPEKCLQFIHKHSKEEQKTCQKQNVIPKL